MKPAIREGKKKSRAQIIMTMTIDRNTKPKNKRVMLHIIPLSSFCPPKIDVAHKITIEFLIYHS
jgi:hypothetical protein